MATKTTIAKTPVKKNTPAAKVPAKSAAPAKAAAPATKKGGLKAGPPPSLLGGKVSAKSLTFQTAGKNKGDSMYVPVFEAIKALAVGEAQVLTTPEGTEAATYRTRVAQAIRLQSIVHPEGHLFRCQVMEDGNVAVVCKKAKPKQAVA